MSEKDKDKEQDSPGAPGHADPAADVENADTGEQQDGPGEGDGGGVLGPPK